MKFHTKSAIRPKSSTFIFKR